MHNQEVYHIIDNEHLCIYVAWQTTCHACTLHRWKTHVEIWQQSFGISLTCLLNSSERIKAIRPEYE